MRKYGNCSSGLKNFADSRPSVSNFKSFSRSLEHFNLTIGQSNFGNNILICNIHSSYHSYLSCVLHIIQSFRQMGDEGPLAFSKFGESNKGTINIPLAPRTRNPNEIAEKNVQTQNLIESRKRNLIFFYKYHFCHREKIHYLILFLNNVHDLC